MKKDSIGPKLLMISLEQEYSKSLANLLQLATAYSKPKNVLPRPHICFTNFIHIGPVP